MIEENFLVLPLFQEWLEKKPTLSESSKKLYLKSVEKFLIETNNISELREYNNFLLKVSHKKSGYHYYYAIKLFIEFQFGNQKQMKEKLLKNLLKPKMNQGRKRNRIHLNEDQIMDVINNLNKQKHRVLALIQTMTSARVGDILRLKRDDITPQLNDDDLLIQLNLHAKGGRRKQVYIYDSTAIFFIVDYITTFFNFDNYLFIELGNMKGRQGNIDSENDLVKMNYQWYWLDLKNSLQLCGINKDDFATHDFRRCFAREVWKKYKDVRVLQKLLGHKDPKTTLLYLEESGLLQMDYYKDIQLNK